MTKVNCILLVDDDKTTNFLNEELINDLEVAEEVHVAWNGQEALDYLHKREKFKPSKQKSFPKPEIIFLDINMPLMGGFEFLNHFNKLSAKKRKGIQVIFLTTSDSSMDKQKVIDSGADYRFMEKPLREQDLLNLLSELK